MTKLVLHVLRYYTSKVQTKNGSFKNHNIWSGRQQIAEQLAEVELRGWCVNERGKTHKRKLPQCINPVRYTASDGDK